MRVRGEGPRPCEVMLIGEAPGWEEARSGRPFVGKSGRELTRYLASAGISRSDVYVTNLVKEQPPFVNGKQLPPSKAEIKRDERELLTELGQVQPKWIICIGKVASSYFLGKVDMETMHGFGYHALATFVQGVPQSLTPTVVPVYHPAAALHNPEVAPLVQWDFQRVGAYLRGEASPQAPIDQYRYPVYEELVQLDTPIVFSPSDRKLGAVDTEGTVARPWGLSLSTMEGAAVVLRRASVPQLQLAQAERLAMHNSLWDVPVLAAMGVEVDWSKIDDTYLMAYCLRVVPQGLKALANRFCGMSMDSYASIVADADRRLMTEWFIRAYEAKRCPCCEGTGKVQRMRKDGKGPKKNEERCPYPGCDAGGLWAPRGEGWSVGRYVRTTHAEIVGQIAEKLANRSDNPVAAEEEADEDTNPFASDGEEDKQGRLRKRVAGWPDDVVTAIEAEVGPVPEVSLDDVPNERAVNYSARDADATLRVYPILKRELKRMELEEAYALDLSVLPVAAEMMRTGMRIDVDYFAKFSAELQQEKTELLDKLATRVGRRVNPASGDQVAAVLYGGGRREFTPTDELEYASALPDSFELQPEKYTKSRSRGSTDDKTLEGLKLKYADDARLVETIDTILAYRQRDKILGTYALKLPRLVDAHGRIHTEIKPCRTATFRWASANPNLQNIPARAKNGVDLGKRVRQGFVASDGCVMGSWDFDQIEMRVLAWFAQDETLLRIFREGLDIHSMTAAKVFRVPFEQFVAELHGDDKALAGKRKDQRTSAKNIGFGVVYGVTPKGLKAQMDLRGQTWTLEDCEALIHSYLHEAYPGVGRFMADAHAEARSTGMVRSYFGHVRYLPSVHSSNQSIAEEALRQAANFKIQCTAAELLKVAMRDLWAEARETLQECGARWLMAVHDELLFELPGDQHTQKVVDTLVTSYMTNPVPLDGVFVGTTGKFDTDWSKLK